MSGFKKYRLNPETLLYEIERVSAKSRILRTLSLIVLSAGLAVLYLWIYTSVLGLELPKTALLRKENARWSSRYELMLMQMDSYESTLEGLQMRDNDIYRNIFGMSEIAPEVRNAGFGGVNRYAYLDGVGANSLLGRTALRMDVLTKKAYVQSKSFDDISAMAQRAGDMASCIPAIPPMLTDPTKYRLTSPFGYRSDPITGISKLHTGFDFACDPGNPVYATGSGTVESVSFELFGYGNSVVIDHGFGYKTRYAHMRDIFVVEGMKVQRGERIGDTGNSGRTTGPHLHYEVMYKGDYVNPANYFNLDMPKEEYASLVEKTAGASSHRMTDHRRGR